LPDRLDLRGLFRRCRRNEETACEAVYSWVSRMTTSILNRKFSNLSRIERGEAADRARFRIVEAMSLGRIDAVDANSDWPIIGYVTQVVEHAAIDVWRERHGTEGSDQLETHPARGPSPEAWAISQELLACIERVLRSVEEADRFIFLLKLNGVSADAIAGDLHRILQIVITTQAIDTRFSRLRVKIQRECPGR